MAGTLDQQNTTQAISYKSYTGYAGKYNGQGVTAGLAGQVVQLDLYLQKFGSPTGNFSVELWTKAALGKPGVKVSDTTLVDISTLTTSLDWYSIAITGSPVYAVSDDYCIVVYYDGGDSSNYLVWGAANSNSYAGGVNSYSADGASWTAETKDLDFKTYMASGRAGGLNISLLGAG